MVYRTHWKIIMRNQRITVPAATFTAQLSSLYTVRSSVMVTFLTVTVTFYLMSIFTILSSGFWSVKDFIEFSSRSAFRALRDVQVGFLRMCSGTISTRNLVRCVHWQVTRLLSSWLIKQPSRLHDHDKVVSLNCLCLQTK